MPRKPQEIIQSLDDRLKPGFTGSQSKKSTEKILRDSRRCIQSLSGALAVIQTWVEFEDGKHADRHEIADLCRRVLAGESRRGIE